MERKLRKGWTTGACAAAAATAAFSALKGAGFPDPVTIELPHGLTSAFPLAAARLDPGRAMAAVVKDAGDDPDVTHGARVEVTLEEAPPGSGLTFRAGPGVGSVTLPGLPLAVGEPAINPGPRAQIAHNIGRIAARLGVPADVRVTIAIAGGEVLAAGTLNARLGIIGGLSILGTSGVVVPYSCSAWAEAIRAGIDVALALGHDHLGAATGKTSEAALVQETGLAATALIDMGDMAGALLRQLSHHKVRRLTLAGGFAKLSKLAQGRMDLHSRAGSPDRAFLAGLLEELGAPAPLAAAARSAPSAACILDMAQGFPLGDRVAVRAREAVLAGLPGGTDIAILAVDRRGLVVGRA